MSRKRAFFGVPVDSQKENGGAAARFLSRIKAGSKKSAQHRAADLRLDKVAACRRVTIGPRGTNIDQDPSKDTNGDLIENHCGLSEKAAAAAIATATFEGSGRDEESLMDCIEQELKCGGRVWQTEPSEADIDYV